jgi:hypothetical protein
MWVPVGGAYVRLTPEVDISPRPRADHMRRPSTRFRAIVIAGVQHELTFHYR